MKIAIVNTNYQYDALFVALGHELVSLAAAELVVFTGGEDVTPKLYGDAAHPTTFSCAARDMVETSVYEIARDKGVPMVGICRGAQFLNVKNGGRMYQHVDKHCGSHDITDLTTGEVVYVTSTHHQMMMPTPDAVLVATSTLGGFREWYDGQVARRDFSKEDIEVVYYPATTSLCCQFHPEMYLGEMTNMQEYFRSLLSRYLGV